MTSHGHKKNGREIRPQVEGKVEELRLAVPLRSGDAVMIDPAKVGKGLDEVASALCGVFFAEARKTKKVDWQASADEVHEEIGWAVQSLGDAGRQSLLHLLIWDQFCRYYGRIAARVNKNARIEVFARIDAEEKAGR